MSNIAPNNGNPLVKVAQHHHDNALSEAQWSAPDGDFATPETEDGGGLRITVDIDELDGGYWVEGAAHSIMDSITGGTPKTSDDGLETEESVAYGADKVLMALELLVPKPTSHIWSVQEGEAGIEVFTPNSFDEFLKNIAIPDIKRDLHDRSHPKTNRWVDFQGLTDHEVRHLGSLLTLHELTIEDIINEDSPEKLEHFEDSKYQYSVLLGQWLDSTSGWKDVKISCVIVKGWMITIHKSPFVGLDELLKRIRKELFGKRRNTTQRVLHGLWVYYGLFDVLVDAMIPRVTRCSEHANDVDEIVLQLWDTSEGSLEMGEATRMIARTRKQINAIRRSFVAKEAIIKEHKLHKLPHYRDVHDHVLQMLDRLDSSRDILAQANSNYLAGISVQASISANSTNEAMRKMSLLAFVFVPMTLITSLFGMNVQVPWQNVGSTLPFYMILTSFLVLPCCAVIVMKMRSTTTHTQRHAYI